MLLEDYALNTRLSYNRLMDQGQQMMILMKGQLMQCTLDVLELIQGDALKWASAYEQCLTAAEAS